MGQCNTSGLPAEVNAYRSELQGIHALLLTLKVLCEVYRITNGSITLACDNEQAVRHANDERLEVPTTVYHADLVRAIRRLRHQLPIQITVLDVDGHKDKLVAFPQLAPLEKLNCLADWDAKNHLLLALDQLGTDNPPATVPNFIHGEGIRIIVGGRKVTGNQKNTLQQQIYREEVAKKLDEKGTLAYEHFSLVNWEAMDQAMTARSPSFCAWVTKHVTGQCGVGRKMKEWKFWEKDNCPCCEEPDETTTHFPFCLHPDVQAAYLHQVEDFKAWMDEAQTDPDISYYFYQALLQKILPTEDLPIPTYPAAEAQSKIGWDNMLFGRVATAWMHLQSEHYQQTKSRRSPDRWAADMVYKLLQLSHSLWMARNGILHERDAQGQLLQEGQSLRNKITERFEKGKQALLPGDYHLLESHSLEVLLGMSPSYKFTWLGAITLAHQSARDHRQSEQGRMRMDLAHYLSFGYCRPVANNPRRTDSDYQSDDDDENDDNTNHNNNDNDDDNNDDINDNNDDDSNNDRENETNDSVSEAMLVAEA